MKVTQIWEVEIDGKTLAFKVYRAGGWWVAEPERPGDLGLTAQSESLDHLLDDLEAVLLDALDRETIWRRCCWTHWTASGSTSKASAATRPTSASFRLLQPKREHYLCS